MKRLCSSHSQLRAHILIGLRVCLELRQALLQRLIFAEDRADQPREFLRDQQQAVFRFLAARDKFRLICRQRVVQAAALEGHRQVSAAAIPARAEWHEQHAEPLRDRAEFFLQILHLLFQQQHEQAAQPAAVRGLRGIAGIEGAQHHRIAFVHQRVDTA